MNAPYVANPDPNAPFDVLFVKPHAPFGASEVAMAWDDDGGGSVVNGVTAMVTVSGDGSEMVRCGGSGRSEWSSGVWRRLW
ncbi:hypothetical protein Tco_1411480, partial [Tanacetum coccineum]